MDSLPLVLLHAFPLDSRMWDGVRDQLKPVTIDQRGGDRSPDLVVIAEDVLAELDRLGVERAVVGGCSMGGYVAMALLRRAPERVAGLVLADTRAGADTDEARANRLAMAERVEAEGVGWVPDAVVPGLLGPDPEDAVVERVRELVLARDPAEVAWAQRAMAARPDSTGLLADVDVPALVLVGEHDRLTPPATARELAAVLRRVDCVELPGVGHLTPLEAPEAFAAAVVAWRQRVDL
ncbi:alpha/beta hydrolase [Saccharothrix longispora]|uniref:alpha/beta fold hydrolase n=1 Tax=Saccharothrix longispora TaxID=33920 RepID=UPI0028FD67DA|nr:alpha/beta hydrolase [Saccharothrix longispora]MBY8847399.1 alpha/beta hydrolase [Saccharothrix sp. MB29]MDU0294887.1 alpha/beta hydrolase [Saccharothrix longispora]